MQADAPPTVQVPDLVGLSEQQALTELERVGLRLVVSSSSDGDIVDTQDPAPGTVVPLGSDVTVITSSDPASIAIMTPSLIAVLLVLVIVAAAIPFLRRWYDAAQRGWVLKHVRARPVMPVQVSPTIAAAPREDEGTGHVIRIEPHAGERRHELEEVRP